MKRSLLALIGTLMIAGSLTACTNNQMGTVGGAALGGVAGYAVTGGSGVGAAVGAVGGGLIGHAVTN